MSAYKRKSWREKLGDDKGLPKVAKAKQTFALLKFLVRRDQNFEQDVKGLSGYLHDARFNPSNLTLRGKTAILTLERDCWEIPYKKNKRTSELASARCQMELSPVSNVVWEFSHDAFLKKEPIWLERIYLGPTHFEKPQSSELILTAPRSGFRLAISFSIPILEDYPKIKLHDLEAPAYWSDTH